MKKKLAILAGLLMVAVAGFTGNIFGDANGDGRVDMADVVAVVNAAMGHAPDNFDEAMADINGNGKVDEEDASLLAESLFNPPFDRTNAVEDDYERAFTQGYLPMKYSARYRKQQITSQEFKALLKPLIEKCCPDKMDYFESRISDYDAPINRCIATGMAYYVARSMGVDTNNSLHNISMGDDFWDGCFEPDLPMFLPYCNDNEETDIPEDKFWRAWCEIQQSYGWNTGHVSPYSDEEVVAYNREAYSWSWLDKFTWEDAVRAITRLYDSIEQDVVYASVYDDRVTKPDASVITPELIAKASQNEIHNMDELPRLYGFIIGPGGSGTDFYKVFSFHPRELKEIADWGFNSANFLFSYLLLFTRDGSQARLDYLQRLDRIVAVAMESGLHLTLQLWDVPGKIQEMTENYYADYKLEQDILNPEKRDQLRAVVQALAKRYKDVPNRNLSFRTGSCTGLTEGEVKAYGDGNTFTVDEIIEWGDFWIDAIREISPERFIIHECAMDHSRSYDEKNFEEKLVGYYEHYQHVSEKYDNTRPVFGYMDMAYGFYQAQTNSGEANGGGNIDFCQHSNNVPSHPSAIYTFNEAMVNDVKQLTIDGCLPAGTVIRFYLAEATEGLLSFAVDGKTVHQETFPEAQTFNVGYFLSFGCPFAESDKMVELTLTEDAQEVTVTANGERYIWSGIRVTLPDAYAVERWWWDSAWDVELGLLAPEDYHDEFYKKRTSTILIGIGGNAEGGDHITIYDDVRFTTGNKVYESSAEFYDRMCRIITERYPKWVSWIEDICNTDNESILRFFDDVAAACQRYGVDYWASPLGNMMEEYNAPFIVAGYEGENFEGHHNFNVKLLRILQKYIDK